MNNAKGANREPFGPKSPALPLMQEGRCRSTGRRQHRFPTTMLLLLLLPAVLVMMMRPSLQMENSAVLERPSLPPIFGERWRKMRGRKESCKTRQPSQYKETSRPLLLPPLPRVGTYPRRGAARGAHLDDGLEKRREHENNAKRGKEGLRAKVAK
jgi:hypothetical protein